MKNRAEYWQPENLGYRFLAEALRLFELEEATPTITTVQAAAIINLAYNLNGIDELGWVYAKKSLQLAQKVSLFSSNPDESAEWQVVAGMTAWCLFNWQSYVLRNDLSAFKGIRTYIHTIILTCTKIRLATFHTFQPPILEGPPNRPLPGVNEETVYYGKYS